MQSPRASLFLCVRKHLKTQSFETFDATGQEKILVSLSSFLGLKKQTKTIPGGENSARAFSRINKLDPDRGQPLLQTPVTFSARTHAMPEVLQSLLGLEGCQGRVQHDGLWAHGSFNNAKPNRLANSLCG
jgi:hypothetical protein